MRKPPPGRYPHLPLGPPTVVKLERSICIVIHDGMGTLHRVRVPYDGDDLREVVQDLADSLSDGVRPWLAECQAGRPAHAQEKSDALPNPNTRISMVLSDQYGDEDETYVCQFEYFGDDMRAVIESLAEMLPTSVRDWLKRRADAEYDEKLP